MNEFNPKCIHVEITQMLYDHYAVDIWDENLESTLDRQYFCAGYMSALFTAGVIEDGRPVYLRKIGDEPELISVKDELRRLAMTVFTKNT